jgi:hypothetical protein
MGSLYSAIDDDKDEYRQICKELKIDPIYSDHSNDVNPYHPNAIAIIQNYKNKKHAENKITMYSNTFKSDLEEYILACQYFDIKPKLTNTKYPIPNPYTKSSLKLIKLYNKLKK